MNEMQVGINGAVIMTTANRGAWKHCTSASHFAYCRSHMDCNDKASNVFGETVKSSTFNSVKPRVDSVFTSKGVVIKPCTADVHHD
jgi:hypothetical protein